MTSQHHGDHSHIKRQGCVSRWKHAQARLSTDEVQCNGVFSARCFGCIVLFGECVVRDQWRLVTSCTDCSRCGRLAVCTLLFVDPRPSPCFFRVFSHCVPGPISKHKHHPAKSPGPHDSHCHLTLALSFHPLSIPLHLTFIWVLRCADFIHCFGLNFTLI